MKAFTDTWLAYAASLDWGPGQRDKSSHQAFLRAGSLGIPADFAIKEVARRIEASGGTFNPSKLENQIRRAYEFVNNRASDMGAIVRPPKASFSPETLNKVASAVTGVDEAWLAKRSTLDPSTVSSQRFLESIYMPGERVLMFTLFESQGQCLYEIGGRWQPLLPRGGPEGVWLLINPVSGEYHPNPRQENKNSRRSEESITSFRYLLLESDVADHGEWLACLAQLPLRIVAIYTSGKKSVHALVRIDAISKADWDLQRNEIKPIVVALGADESALTAVRLSRLPGAMRGDRLQKLLYLNPSADGTPIISL